MAKITPQANTSVQIGPCTLVYTATSAQMLNPNGIEVWAISETMFPPSQVGTAPVVSVTVKTTSRMIHPPPPGGGGGGGGLKQIEPQAAAALTPAVAPATTITIETITITLSGARFAGTNIPADCSMVVRQTSNSDDPGVSFPTITYSQTFGGLSFSGEDDDFLGFITVTAPIPAGNLSLPQSSSATLNAGAGLTASIDIAPGYMNLYSGLNGNPVALVNSAAIGNFGVATLSIVATQGSVVLSFPAPAPAYQTAFTIQQPEGWLVAPPDTATTIGTLSAVASGGNFDTALILAGEDASANLTFVGFLELRLSANAATETQYTLSLLSGLALAGDATAAPVQVSLIGCQLNLTATGAILSGSFATLNPAPLTTGSIALWPTTGSIAGGVSLDFSMSPAAATNAFLNLAQALCSLPDALTRPLPWTGNTGLALVTAPPPIAPAFASYLILGGVAADAVQVVLTGISMELTRPVDMAVASFSFQNCGVQQVGGGGLSFVQWGGDPQNQTPFITVILPPQHISENAYPLNDDNSPQGTLGPPPVPTRMAGATSLLMELQLEGALPLTAETLFDWTNNTLISPQPGSIAQPAPTSAMVLELPYRLDLSLDPDAGWVQQPTPAPEAATSPMWHARLGVQQGRSNGDGLFVNERPGVQKNARAPWTPDTPGAGSAFADEALSAADRENIVAESEEASTEISVDHLILSPLGAWADLRLVSPGSPLSAWTQIISQGRDQYVRAVNVGYLLPWGHVASIVEVAERRFSSDASNTAYLSTKKYIVVGEPTRTYMQQPNGAPMLRDAVLTQVDLLTQITPAVDQALGAITVPGDGSGPALCRM